MPSQEIRALNRAIPFSTNGDSDPLMDSPGGAGVMVLQWIGAASNQAPGYWSTARDIWLRSFYLRSDYLKITVATFVQKAYAVPLAIIARDHNVKAHVALAEQLHGDIMRNSGLLKGFFGEFAKFATDYVTQDNGAFMLVMGGGKANGPIVGPVVGLMHLDSQYCTRTGNPEYPVVYTHTDGKRYKLHYTRVIFLSSMPSGNAELYDVGLCAVSRCIDAAQDLLDVMVYNAEKFGSRPARQILYGKTGVTLKNINDAIALANTKMNSQGLDRFSRTVLMAPAAPTGTMDLGTLDLASAPDGFNRNEVTILDIAVIAGAFGLDLRDLAHSLGLQGQTKADAEIQHLKTRGKGVEQFLTDFTEQLNQKALPDTLEAYFDYIDDTQDRQAADIAEVRARGRQIDLTSGVITVRLAREQMLENGEIDQDQFDSLELAEGRLPDGLDVLMLFQSQDSEISRILGGIVDNPLNSQIMSVDVDGQPQPVDPLGDIINERMLLAWQRHDTAPNANIKRKMRQAIAALTKLQAIVRPVETEPETTPTEDEQPAEDEDEPEPATVKSYHTKQDEDLDELMGTYSDDFDELVTAANNGEMKQDDFDRELEALVAAMLLAAFLRGSRLSEAELTARIRERVDEGIDINLDSIPGLSGDIYSGRYQPEQLGEEGAGRRVEMWVNSLAGMYALGQLHRRDDPRFEWVVGPTEHCETCARLNGQVHTASEWLSSGYAPQSGSLACRGLRCQCQLSETSEPVQGGF